jgi:hypothetical protein
MKAHSKKTRLSISVDPDLVEKLSEEAVKHYGGNVSRLITAVLWRQFFEENGGGGAGAGAGTEGEEARHAGEEVERCHGLLLRLLQERKLPAWVSVQTGEIVVDGQSFPYVKRWSVKEGAPGQPTREVVEVLRRWMGKKASG